MTVHKIKKGFDIKIAGSAQKVVEEVSPGSLLALKPSDFYGFRGKLMVQEGDSVKTGQPLMYARHMPEVFFGSPGTGIIKEIRRGHRRALLQIVVECSGDEFWGDGASWDLSRIQSASHDDLVDHLLKGCMWPYIRQRPFHKIADYTQKPQAVFINGMDTEPLACDPNVLVNGRDDVFQLGVEALGKLTRGKVYLTLKAGVDPASAFKNVRGVETHYFKGPHPSGLVGTHIRRIEPLKPGACIWYVRAGDVAGIGEFLKTGHYPVNRIVALAGSGVTDRKYIKTRLGIRIRDLLKNRLAQGNYRIISGTVLSGDAVDLDGYLGFYSNTCTVIPDSHKRDLFGWGMPGFGRYSLFKAYASCLIPRSRYNLDTRLNGGVRPIVNIGAWEKVFALDIHLSYLVRAILAEDLEEAESLGLLEVAEEDVALCTFACPSKIEVGDIIRQGQDKYEKEFI